MAMGKVKEEWSRWSSWFSLFGNANRDPKKTDAFEPGDFDPFVKRVKKMLDKKTSVQHISAMLGAKKRP